MSADEQELVFESFLKKRKDKMKMKWATYWFRLQNTSLFFYTKKHGSAVHLRGQYYIYMVQSVREVARRGSKPFAFEITMKNGRTKLLAAETQELRHAWVGLLWKAMQLPGPGRSDSACVWDDVAELKQMAHGSSDSDGAVNLMDSLYSTPIQWNRTAPSQNPWPQSKLNLPSANNASLSIAGKHTLYPEEDRLQEMGIYDTPLSNKKACEDKPPGSKDTSEGIYDVPSFWRANKPEQTLGTPARDERSPSSVMLQL